MKGPYDLFMTLSSTFEELFNKEKSVTIHHINLLVLATELQKVYNGLALDFMDNIFEIRNVKYNFNNDSLFATRNGSSYSRMDQIKFVEDKLTKSEVKQST